MVLGTTDSGARVGGEARGATHHHPARCLITALACATVVFADPISVVAQQAGPEHVEIELPRDSTILATANAIIVAAGSLETLWPNFWGRSSAFTLYSPEVGAFLFSDERPGEGFRPVVVSETFPSLQGVTYATRRLPAGISRSTGPLGFNPRFQSGAVLAPSMQVGETIAQTIGMLFHEAFHGFQFRTMYAGGFPAPQQDFFNDSVSLGAAEYNVLAGIERELLAEVLSLRLDSAQVRLAEYMAVRDRRERGGSPGFVAAERFQETLEGTAQYVGDMSVVHVLGGSSNDLRNSLSSRLREPLEMWQWLGDLYGARKLQWYHRIRLYQTGVALALVLNDLHPTWKEEVTGGAKLYELLLQLPERQHIDADAQSVLERYDYASRMEATKMELGADWSLP